MADRAQPTVVAIIGAGPRGIGLVERLAENHAEFGGELHIRLIDPHPAGPGRIWRFDQSPLLKLNSLAEDVTLFTDSSSTIEGPIVPGPSLAEWARLVRDGLIRDVTPSDPALAAELAGLGPKSFPTRRLQSLYLDWFLRRTLSRLPEGVTVTHDEDPAVAVDDLPGGRQRVRLERGGAIEVDAVVYALGHSSSALDAESARLAAFAGAHDLFYLPPSYTADAYLSGIAAGETVLVRGLGLAAVDLLVLLGEGRGGRFTRVDGVLRYAPSGREPRIVIGSGRGVPYHSKITSALVGAPPAPRYFSAPIAASIVAAHERLDFREHVWPAIAKEMLHGYYAELFSGHPSRVRIPWESFVARLDAVDPFGDDRHELVADALVDPADELDLVRFDRPLDGLSSVGQASTGSASAGLPLAEVDAAVREYIRDDLDRRTHPRHSATQGLFLSLLQAYGVMLGIVDAPNWTAKSRERDLGGGWVRYFSFVSSGPPGPRLEEMLALAEAGIVTFFGAGMTVAADEATGLFTARGSSTGDVVTARALVEAWLPSESVLTSDNPVLRDLVDSGVGVEHVVSDPAVGFDGVDADPAVDTGVAVAARRFATGLVSVIGADARVRRPDGTAHPRRFAVGPSTSAPFVGAFSRPRTNALAFRENDAVARGVLSSVAPATPSAAPPAPAAPAPSAEKVSVHDLLMSGGSD